LAAARALGLTPITRSGTTRAVTAEFIERAVEDVLRRDRNG
jgi:hypothetical protein